MGSISTVATMTLDGGDVCLDFINSGYDKRDDESADRLHTYADFLLLSRRLKLISDTESEELGTLAGRKPAEAAAVLDMTRGLRSALYNLFTAGDSAESGDRRHSALAIVNSALAEVWPQTELVYAAGRYSLDLKSPQQNLKYPLWQCVRAALRLLEVVSPGEVKQCKGCLWLFIDRSKNHGRRWCSMQSCGSESKSKRYYHRKKGVAKSAERPGE